MDFKPTSPTMVQRQSPSKRPGSARPTRKLSARRAFGTLPNNVTQESWTIGNASPIKKSISKAQNVDKRRASLRNSSARKLLRAAAATAAPPQQPAPKPKPKTRAPLPPMAGKFHTLDSGMIDAFLAMRRAADMAPSTPCTPRTPPKATVESPSKPLPPLSEPPVPPPPPSTASPSKFSMAQSTSSSMSSSSSSTLRPRRSRRSSRLRSMPPTQATLEMAVAATKMAAQAVKAQDQKNAMIDDAPPQLPPNTECVDGGETRRLQQQVSVLELEVANLQKRLEFKDQMISKLKSCHERKERQLNQDLKEAQRMLQILQAGASMMK